MTLIVREAAAPGTAGARGDLAQLGNPAIRTSSRSPHLHLVASKIKDAIAWLITLGGRSAYRISIAWKEKVKIVLDDDGKTIQTTGYPFEP